MRHLRRSRLEPATRAKLSALSEKVARDPNPKRRAAQLWKRKDGPTFERIRKKLETTASGRSRCMYCEDSAGTDIEHFRPRSKYPTDAFSWPNYLLACSYCNSNLKRDEFPLDAQGAPLLIDPTSEDPAIHLVLSPRTGRYVPKDDKGRESIRVFGLNDPTTPRQLPRGRLNAIQKFRLLLGEYDRELARRPEYASEIRRVVTDEPFSAVLTWLVHAASAPGGADVLGRDFASLIHRHGVRDWL